MKRGSITRCGNVVLGKLLVEAAWHYRHKPSKSTAITLRNKRLPKRIQDISWKAQGKAIALLRSVTAETDSETAWDQYNKVADRLSSDHPQLTCLITPVKRCWPVLSTLLYSGGKIRTNNPLENLNSQVERRTGTVGIFPNRDSVILT
jgi:transposase-like protein